MESLKKAQQQYDFIRLPPAGITNKQISMAFGDGDFDTDECEAILRTPRGSSRASRVSSLAHSHRSLCQTLYYCYYLIMRTLKDVTCNSKKICLFHTKKVGKTEFVKFNCQI